VRGAIPGGVADTDPENAGRGGSIFGACLGTEGEACAEATSTAAIRTVTADWSDGAASGFAVKT